MSDSRADLLKRGHDVMLEFGRINDCSLPIVHVADSSKWSWSMCAYYRPSRGIVICVPRCAAPGFAGRMWSWPGYTVDRTPYGVVQHELGHHVDVQRGYHKGSYWSEFSTGVREASGEEPITSYCPNNAEWFAEMFRVFVTNPDLLRQVRPRTHRELAGRFKPVFSDSWRARLAGAPERTLKAAERQVERLAA